LPRVCFTLQVRPDRLEEYRAAHAAVWPEMLRALRDAGWRDYSLYLREDGLLVGHLETDDLAAAQAAMERTEVNARWQAAMAGYFTGLDGVPADRGLHVLDEVFHLETQLGRLDATTDPASATEPTSATGPTSAADPMSAGSASTESTSADPARTDPARTDPPGAQS
jgi:L-rhamnose mutarotase